MNIYVGNIEGKFVAGTEVVRFLAFCALRSGYDWLFRGVQA
jgi:hypothetical protein